MKRSALLVFVLAAVAVQALGASQETNDVDKCKNAKLGDQPHLFDNYVLTLHSRGGYCAFHSCKKHHGHRHAPLTLKGLRTRLSNGKEGPTACMAVDFDVKSLGPFKANLTKDWPSFDSKVSNEDLWKNEVEKYGSCVMCQDKNVKNALAYLRTAVVLNRFDSVVAKFAKHGVKPSHKKPVALKDLEAALKGSDLSGTTEFYCEGKRKNLDVLQEVRMCLSTEFISVPCPPMGRPSCTTDKVWYLGN